MRTGWPVSAARRALPVNPDVAEFGVMLRLDEVVADLVDELEVLLEDLSEGVGDLLVDDEAIQDRVVSAYGDGIDVRVEVE